MGGNTPWGEHPWGGNTPWGGTPMGGNTHGGWNTPWGGTPHGGEHPLGGTPKGGGTPPGGENPKDPVQVQTEKEHRDGMGWGGMGWEGSPKMVTVMAVPMGECAGPWADPHRLSHSFPASHQGGALPLKCCTWPAAYTACAPPPLVGGRSGVLALQPLPALAPPQRLPGMTSLFVFL